MLQSLKDDYKGGPVKKITLAFCSTLLFSVNTFATININGTQAARLWNQIDTIGKIEKIQMIRTENNQQVIHIEHIACVFEMYNGCSMWVETETERKMIVALDGTAEFMNQLAKAGVAVDEDNARMYINAIDCVNDSTNTICKIDAEEKIVPNLK
jgi:ribosomal protein S19